MAEMNCQCGLLTASKDPVPLKSISVDIQIKGFVADVSATLTYKNEEKNPVEAIFVFPMDDDSAVYNFEAMVDGKKIVAEIQEKKQAEETYADAISQGQEAFLLEEDESSGDIFTCSVGNLPPGQESAVTLSFVRELPLEPDGAVRFVLPAVLNPRYTPREAGTASVTAGIPRVPSGQLSYSLKVTASITSAYGVSHVQSNCGLTPLQYLKEDKTSAKVSLADEHKFDKDVELLIYYQEVNKPSVLVESPQLNAHPGSLMADAMLMLNFYPNVPESQEQSSSGEFIFLLDRSGSMSCSMNNESNSPTRIDSAKETMLLLLKSLPLGCYFNVFGFGSHYDSFFPESVEYTQDSMKTAVKKIEGIGADMGGTEILEPLKHIYSKVGKPGHPRQLFVFTDGEVDNTKSVIAEVQRNSNDHRCFAFGIGEGASTALIKGIARAANGTSEFITGKERMQPKALQTLKCSLQPVVKDVSLKWTLPTGLESVLLSQLPNAIFRGQRSILYAQLKGKIGEATDADVSLEYKYNDEIFKNTIQFSIQPEKETRQTIHRLAAKNVIKDLENSKDKEKEEVKKTILETSLQSSVICSLTGFVAVNKNLNQPIQGPLIQRHIPLGGRQFHMAPQMMRCAMPGGGGGGRSLMVGLSVCRSAPVPVGLMMMADCSPMAACGAPATGGLVLGESLEVEMSDEDKTDAVVRLVSLQNADGSWPLDAEFATALELTQKELQEKAPGKDIDQSVWATVLALVWLHSTSADRRDEWELLEGKALKWVKTKAGTSLAGCVVAANALLKASVDPKVFGL